MSDADSDALGKWRVSRARTISNFPANDTRGCIGKETRNDERSPLILRWPKVLTTMGNELLVGVGGEEGEGWC